MTIGEMPPIGTPPLDHWLRQRKATPEDWTWLLERHSDLQAAITRFKAAGKEVPERWIIESKLLVTLLRFKTDSLN